MLIRTPGTTAPEGSVRVPVMAPRSWAAHAIENSSIPASSRSLVIVWFPLFASTVVGLYHRGAANHGCRRLSRRLRARSSKTDLVVTKAEDFSREQRSRLKAGCSQD